MREIKFVKFKTWILKRKWHKIIGKNGFIIGHICHERIISKKKDKKPVIYIECSGDGKELRDAITYLHKTYNGGIIRMRGIYNSKLPIELKDNIVLEGIIEKNERPKKTLP